MKGMKIMAILLIVAGVLGLAYGGFSYTKRSKTTVIGPIELAVNERKNVTIPIWAGITAIVVGGGLLLIRRKNG